MRVIPLRRRMIAVLGVAMGLVLGLTGAGGSILSVPLLMWAMDWTLPQATPVSLLAVCAAASFGTVTHWDVAQVRYRAATLMAIAGLLTAPLGIWLAGALPLGLLTALFAAVLLAVATKLWRQARTAPTTIAENDEDRAAALCRLNPETGRIIWTVPTALAVAGIGATTGLLAGLLGIGAFVIVASLRSLSELSMHSAAATSLMATALISAGTVGLTVIAGRHLPWLLAIPFVLGALAGTLAGRALAQRIAGPWLQKTFATLIAIVGGGMALHSAQLV